MEHKHTQGKWGMYPTGKVMQGYSQPLVIVEDGTPNLICGIFGDVKGGLEVAEANAQLIADAGTTANDCGLLPSELLQQRNELLESLKELYNSIDSCIDLTPKVLRKAKSAIEKAAKKEMDLKTAMTFVIGDIESGNERRLRFSNKEAADTFSESIKHLWPTGKGHVYGQFTEGNVSFYEVSY